MNTKLGIIQLSDGTELRATDPQQLQALKSAIASPSCLRTAMVATCCCALRLRTSRTQFHARTFDGTRSGWIAVQGHMRDHGGDQPFLELGDNRSVRVSNDAE
jgi:hypothetical protein